jgi:hypothetical protein
MANTIDPYNPIYYAQEALMVLEQTLNMTSRVYHGYDEERRSFDKGSSIQIRKPDTMTTQTGGTGTVNDIAPKSITLTLDQWKEVKFGLTDKELAYTGERIITEHISPAVYALAYDIEKSLTDLYKHVPWSYNASSNPTAADIVNARKVLRDNAGPIVDSDMVHFALDSWFEAKLLNLELFHAARIAGEADNKEALRNGGLGTRFGVEHFVQQTMGTAHTSGTVISGTNDVAGALSATAAKNATSIGVDGLTGTETLAVGDSFVIAGNTQRYVVTTAATLATGAATLSIYPALVQEYGNNAVVTFETISATNYADSYYANLMFHRNAFAIALAPLPISDPGQEPTWRWSPIRVPG